MFTQNARINAMNKKVKDLKPDQGLEDLFQPKVDCATAMNQSNQNLEKLSRDWWN